MPISPDPPRGQNNNSSCIYYKLNNLVVLIRPFNVISLSIETLKPKDFANKFAKPPVIITLKNFLVSCLIKAITLFMDSPVMAYGKYSSRMIVVEPQGEKDSTTHDTLGKDKISIDTVLSEALKLLN